MSTFMVHECGHQRGGKRNRRDSKQQKPVEQQKRVVDLPDMGEQPVMVEPHDEDSEKTRKIAYVCGPLVRQEREQRRAMSQFLRTRHFEVQHQQGNSYRKNAVAERLNAPRLLLVYRLDYE